MSHRRHLILLCLLLAGTRAAAGVDLEQSRAELERPCLASDNQGTAAGAEGQRLAARTASAIDPALPDKPFEAWLRGLLPNGVDLTCSRSECARTENLAREGPQRQCLSVRADIISRARTAELLFEEWDLRFLTGAVVSHESDERIELSSLSALPEALVTAFVPAPLECPVGTLVRRRASYAGLFEWCEDTDGEKHGPYRSWFSTGIYLMAKGRYERGEKTGVWIECSRFEHCLQTTY